MSVLESVSFGECQLWRIHRWQATSINRTLVCFFVLCPQWIPRYSSQLLLHQLYLRSWSKFTQKPHTIMESAHMHMKHKHSLCYMWKRSDVSSLRKREASQEWTCVQWCVRLPTPRYMAYLRCCPPMKLEKKFDTITCTFVFHCVGHHLFTIIIHSSRSVRQCTTIRGYDTAFLYKAWQKLHTHTHTHTQIYIQTLAQYQTAVVKTTCLATLGNNFVHNK